jgi:hypothetical protein
MNLRQKGGACGGMGCKMGIVGLGGGEVGNVQILLRRICVIALRSLCFPFTPPVQGLAQKNTHSP